MLLMLYIPIDGLTSLFCNNMSMVMNTTCPESMLKKKHNSVSCKPASLQNSGN